MEARWRSGAFCGWSGKRFQTVGYLFAADEATAISEAIKKFDLVGRDLELVAHRVPQPPKSND